MRGVIQRPIVYDCLMRPLEGSAYGRRRKQLFGSLSGEILEIGVGTGRNLDAYGPQARVTACDIEPQLVALAWSRAVQRRMPVLVADAQRLPFRTAHFRYVTAALVFCSLPHPARALREIARVLQPDGRLIQLEHTLTDHHVPDVLLDLLAPSWKTFTGGCVLNRDTTALLTSLGWHLVRHERYVGGLVRLIEALPPGTIDAALHV
jgi:ubiquinone/menaquinone biosynthesis C-methylase UbiE